MYKYRDIKGLKKFIIKELKLKTKVKLRLLKNAKLLLMPDNTKAVGAYNHTLRVIMLPLKQPKWDIYGTMAHEYVHVWQNENNLESNEDQADEMACELCTKYFGVQFGIVEVN